MSTNYTPGPWYALNNEDDGAVVVDRDSYHVADCNGGRSLEQDEANARAISLLPELVEALRELAQLTQGVTTNMGRLRAMQSATRARALLARIDGETQ